MKLWQILRSLFVSISMLGFLSACATSEYDEIQEQMAEESEQEIQQQEELIEEELAEETEGDTEVTEPEVPSEELEDVMQEPMGDLSSEALASELDKLTTPEGGEGDVGVDDQTVVDTDPTEDETVPTYTEPEVDNSLGSTGDGSSGEYVVQPGDTLGKIANVVYGNSNRWRELADENGISNPRRIFPVEVIRFSLDSRGQGFNDAYTALEPEVIMVQAGDTLSVIAERLFGRADYWKPIWHLNKAEIPDPNNITPGQVVKYHDPKKMAQNLSDAGYQGLSH